jgi:hypothetical protein
MSVTTTPRTPRVCPTCGMTGGCLCPGGPAPVPSRPTPPAGRPLSNYLPGRNDVPVVLMFVVMVTVLITTWNRDESIEPSWFERMVSSLTAWLRVNAQPLAVGAFLVACAGRFTDWRKHMGELRAAVVGAWTWRVVGTYAAGLALAGAQLHLSLAWAGDSSTLQTSAWCGFLAVCLGTALVAHWQPGWSNKVPPIEVLGWVAGVVAVFPVWIWLYRQVI